MDLTKSADSDPTAPEHSDLEVCTFFSNINPQYTGGLFHYYMLDESICHFRGVMSILSLYSILLANSEDPYQTPHHVASDLCLHCLPMTILWISR